MSTETPAIIDSLPYIDTAIDDNEELRVLAMREVDLELEVFPPDKDYLTYLPDISRRPFRTDLLRHEYESIENNESRPDSCQLSRLNVDIPPPASSIMDEEELELWSKCLNQIKIKLEYKQRQMVNLEILKCYGTPAWQEFISENERMEASLNSELHDLTNRAQEVNWARKSDQQRVQKRLDILRNEWINVVDKNRMLADEITRLKTTLAKETSNE